jgi:hypothetical protein
MSVARTILRLYEYVKLKNIRLYMCERGWRVAGYNQTLYFTVVLRWDLLVFFSTKNAATAHYVLESITAGHTALVQPMGFSF